MHRNVTTSITELQLRGERACAVQADEWPWLARGLPSLRSLLMQNVRAGTNGQWPTALAGCTRLTELHLHGRSAPPLPNGGYLSCLQKLSWLSERRAALPGALAHSSSIQELGVGLQPQRLSMLSLLETLPNLEVVLLVVRRYSAIDVFDFPELKQRFSSINFRCEYVSEHEWRQVL